MRNRNSTVSNQVMWNRLISVVEEQAQALIRTAFSTSVREAGDLSAGVYEETGKMMAQAITGTPGHVNAMADAVRHFINTIGNENIFEGDVFITNNPWKGTGHLHDITVVTPFFYKKFFVGFFACTAHVVDIGGRGFGADGNSIYEEGIQIPIMKLAKKGVIDNSIIKIIRENVRESEQIIGDIFALVACNEVGLRRLTEMMAEFSISDLREIADFIFRNSYLATVEKISALPRKSARGEMTIDGYSKPIKLSVKIKVFSDKVVCDFSGSSSVDKKGINVPLVYTKAYSCYALKCAIAPEIPNNAASLKPFKITAPENSILNALHPSPVALRHVTGQLLPDTIYNALDKIIPKRVPAEGSSTLCNFQISIRPRTDKKPPPNSTRAEVLTFNSGGTGARPSIDGLNATAFPSGVMTMPVEATENSGPVIIWRKELRPDSGGSGKYRGGLGQYMEIGVTAGHEFDFQAMFDRVKYPPRGRAGGSNGKPTKVRSNDGEIFKGKGKKSLSHGQRVLLAFPGGGGYGNTNERDIESIFKDLAQGYISAEAAKKEYGLTEKDIHYVLSSVKLGKVF